MNKKYDIVFFVDIASITTIKKMYLDLMVDNEQDIYLPQVELDRLNALINDPNTAKPLKNELKERSNLINKLLKKKKLKIFGKDINNDIDLHIAKFLLENTRYNVLVIVNDKNRKDIFLLLKGSFENNNHYIDVARADNERILVYGKGEISKEFANKDIKMIIKENFKDTINEDGIVPEPTEEADIMAEYQLAEPLEGESLPESHDNPDHEKEYSHIDIDRSVENKVRTGEVEKGEEIDFGKEMENDETIETKIVEEPDNEELIEEHTKEEEPAPEEVVESEDKSDAYIENAPETNSNQPEEEELVQDETTDEEVELEENPEEVTPENVITIDEDESVVDDSNDEGFVDNFTDEEATSETTESTVAEDENQETEGEVNDFFGDVNKVVNDNDTPIDDINDNADKEETVDDNTGEDTQNSDDVERPVDQNSKTEQENETASEVENEEEENDDFVDRFKF